MSALWAPAPDRAGDPTPAGGGSRATSVGSSRLRPLPTPAPRLARFPFLLAMIALFGVGMAGLLMLNTTLQNQAFQSRTLDRQATELAYTQADLENQLAILAAPQELAQRASLQGMRPNPYPALLVVPGGKVVGRAKPVARSEVPSLIVKTSAEMAADRAAATANLVTAAAMRTADVIVKADARAAKAAAEAQAAQAKAKAAADAKAAAENKASTNPSTADQNAPAKPNTSKKSDGGRG